MLCRIPLRAFIALCLLPLLTLTAWADFSFTAKTTTSGNAGAAMNLALGGMPGGTLTSVYIHNGLVRADSGGVIRILDFRNQLAIQITPATKTYSEMTFAQMRQIVQSAQSAMPPFGSAPGIVGAQAGENVQSTGEAVQIGRWQARQVIVTVAPPVPADSPQVSMRFDLWLTQQLNASEWDNLLQQHSKLLLWLIPAAGGGLNLSMMLNGRTAPSEPQLKGISVKATMTMQMTHFPGPATASPLQPLTVVTTVRLLAASNALIPASKFAIPTGYRKVDTARQP